MSEYEARVVIRQGNVSRARRCFVCCSFDRDCVYACISNILCVQYTVHVLLSRIRPKNPMNFLFMLEAATINRTFRPVSR